MLNQNKYKDKLLNNKKILLRYVEQNKTFTSLASVRNGQIQVAADMNISTSMVE